MQKINKIYKCEREILLYMCIYMRVAIATIAECQGRTHPCLISTDGKRRRRIVEKQHTRYIIYEYFNVYI